MHIEIVRGSPPVTVLTSHDRVALVRLLREASGRLKREMPGIGAYKRMTDSDIWWHLVVQICVRGSAKHMDSLAADPEKFDLAKQEIALDRVTQNGRSFLRQILNRYGMTRFQTRAADAIFDLSRNPKVVKDSRITLLDGLQSIKSVHEQRSELMRRCAVFRLKSASDFMITVGLTDDVIALDVRVVGALNRCLDLELKAGRIQGSRAIYESIEDALRKVCQKAGYPLAVLDRTIFQFTSVNAVDFILTKN